ncbi:MAG: tripartite tricarboxylate transporter substrate binding protein [Candidatus Hodarchaeota archaeon]
MNKRLSKLSVLMTLATCCFLFLFVNLAIGSDYPTRPVTFMVPYGAGGTTDLTFRAFCEAASKYLGERIVPVNKPGAGGTIAAMAVSTAKPDGYTIGGGTTSPALIAPFSPNSPYKNLDGFRFISNIGKYVYVFMVTSDASWKTWKEFIDWARAKPRGAKVGMPGAVTVMAQGFMISQAADKEKAELTYVSFKSGPEVLTATLGGHITMYASTFDANVKSFLDQGKFRVLAFGDMKPAGLPEYESTPTLRDVYGLEVVPNLKAIWGPRGLPDPIVKKLDEAFEKATKDPIFTNVMSRFYMPVVYMNSKETTEYANKTLKGIAELKERLK